MESSRLAPRRDKARILGMTVAEASRLDVREIKIGTEMLGNAGQSRPVSTIEIKLTKKD